MTCETTRWYLGLFVDNLEDYDIRKLDDIITWAADDTNSFASDVDKQAEEYFYDGEKKQVEYQWDSEREMYFAE